MPDAQKNLRSGLRIRYTVLTATVRKLHKSRHRQSITEKYAFKRQQINYNNESTYTAGILHSKRDFGEDMPQMGNAREW